VNSFITYLHTNIVVPLVKPTVNWKTLKDDSKLKKATPFIVVWLPTTIIMWFYVFFSYSVFDTPLVATLGLTYTIVHTLVPVLYRVYPSLTMAGLTISLSALAFQITFAIFNGGINSPAAIWFTIHPVVISFFASKRLVLFSVLLNMIIVTTLTILGMKGFFPLDQLSKNLTETMAITSLIGLDILIAVYTFVYMFTAEKAQKELEKKNELFENLIRIVSHDIKNSLNISDLSIRSLGRHIDDTELTAKLEKIKRSNDQINDISKTVLSWLKSNEMSFNLELTPTPLQELINDINEDFDLMLKAKGLKIDVESSLDLAQKVLIDKEAFKYQVLNNILSNAIKFSPTGDIISILICSHKSNVDITISDKGQGMKMEQIRAILEEENTASTLGTQGEKGTGFGLRIAKSLVENMCGSLKVVSNTTGSAKSTGTSITLSINKA